mmetsp:Transcript_17730/g.26840  ORF Transcript_17730/g.26840 Transcript_17730/m.26840 type:complete len:174 (+) Transcript_17730:50-571(+)
MNNMLNRTDGSDEPRRGNKVAEIALMIRNNTKIQGIVSSHRDDVMTMFRSDVPASKMITLRLENLSAIKSSLSTSPSTLPSSLPSVLQELLVKAEDEAMKIFQIVNAHREEALAMFRSDAPASRMVTLRMDNLSKMKSTMAFAPTLPSTLQEFLVKAEEEAIKGFQKENLHGL